MRDMMLYIVLIIFLVISVGAIIASVWFFISLGRTVIKDTIKTELAVLRRETIPKPNRIMIRTYSRAGMDAPLYVVSLNYECSSVKSARELEQRIKKIFERMPE